jgi:hypothetical protein
MSTRKNKRDIPAARRVRVRHDAGATTFFDNSRFEVFLKEETLRVERWCLLPVRRAVDACMLAGGKCSLEGLRTTVYQYECSSYIECSYTRTVGEI